MVAIALKTIQEEIDNDCSEDEEIVPFGDLKTSRNQGNRFEAVKDFQLTVGISLS